MPSSIFFNGRLIYSPGSYSEVDVSSLEQVGLGASGIVAMLGEAEGGVPVSAYSVVGDIVRFNNPSQVRKGFRSGDLRDAGGMIFDPSSDGIIQAGAQQIVAMKVNPATQSVASFANVNGNALDLNSADYGAFTGQINVAIGTGTSKGKQISIIFEDITEAGDDIGGDTMFQLKYVKPTGGWDTMSGELQSGGNLECLATRDNAGLLAEVTALLAPGAARIVSAGADTATVTLYGLDATGAAVSETLTLNGAVPVNGTQVFGAGKLLGAKINGTNANAVTISDQVIPTTIMTLTAGTNKVAGMVLGSAMYVSNSIVTLVADGASAADAMLVGTNAAGAVQLEKITLNGTAPVPGVGLFSTLTGIVLGEVAGGVIVTTSASSAKSLASVQSNVVKAADYFNAKSYVVGPTTYGFVFTLVTGRLTFLMSDMDVMPAAVSVLSPANPTFLADLFLLVEWINANSQLVEAAAASGASGGAPDNTTAPVFLSGGVEGATAQQDWQDALDWLKQIRVNTIVALTGDPAIHSIIDEHCAYMGGVGRSERDAKLGAMNAALTDVPTKAEYKSQIVDLNSRHVSLCGQAVERYNPEGERTEYPSPFAGCVAAGMQAGSPVGTALTYKYANVLGVRQDASWNPTEDAEEMLAAGAFFLESVDGVGRRWVRGLTTYISSNNLAFSEQSVNEAANFATFSFRSSMEIVVGRPGFQGTVNAAKGTSENTLGLLVDAGVLVTWNPPTFDLSADVLSIALELSPVVPINFVKTTLHLVTTRLTA